MIRAGCFLSAYELIKSEVVDNLHEFYWRGWHDGQNIYADYEYNREVLALGKGKYRASCAWLVKMGALTADHVAQLDEIHMHRQEIAHELPKLIVDPDFEVRTDLLVAAVECIRKLGVFWGSISADSNPTSMESRSTTRRSSRGRSF